MPEDYYNTSQASIALPRSGVSMRVVLALTLLGFLGGGALAGWLVSQGRIKLDPALISAEKPAERAAPQAALTAPTASATAPTPAAAASEAAKTDATSANGSVDQRVAALEQRFSRMDAQAAVAEGNTARAEGLLIALAVRRAVERGAALGYLTDQLKLRFADSQPNAVTTIVEASKRPLTLDQLAAQLDALTPSLTGAAKTEGGWARVQRELSGLFVIRSDAAQSTNPRDRIERAKLLLNSGQFERAADEIARMPDSGSAARWIADTRSYAATQQALDRIETAALLEPAKPVSPATNGAARDVAGASQSF